VPLDAASGCGKPRLPLNDERCGSTDKRRREQTRDSGQDQSSPTPMPKMARPCVIKTLFVTTLHNAIA